MKVICKICSKEYNRCCELVQHLRVQHKLTAETYYKSYIDANKHFCMNCGKEMQFNTLAVPYLNYCSRQCSRTSNIVKQKREKTLNERYGVSYALQNNEIHEKQKNTVTEKFGTDNIWKSDYFKEHIKQHNLEKYGVEYYTQTEQMKQQSKSTKKKRYGTENYVNADKIKETKKLKYGSANYANVTQGKMTLNSRMLREYKEKYESDTFKITGLVKGTAFCTCSKCNSNFSISRLLLRERFNAGEDICINCNQIIKPISNKEKELYEYMKNISPFPVYESDRTVLHGKELDIFVPKNNLAVEFDGLWWHNEINKTDDYHIAKTKNCEAVGVQLIHVFEDEWDYKKEIVKSRIRGLLGLNQRVYARKTVCKEITSRASKEFLEKNHIQGNCNSKYRYGLFINDELVSVMTFGKSRFKDEFELLRFANKLNTNVVGGASKLFKHFLNDHPEITKIVSYADRRWSKGNLYYALGFKLEHETPPSYSYIVNGICENRMKYQKHKLVADGYDSKLSEHDIMISRGLYRIYDCGTLKFSYSNEKIS